MIHYCTTNKSFIYMHKVLKEMGIKNNLFMLQLYDRELLHVDPFREDLSEEIKSRIHYEISRNIWYYFREIVRIPATGEKIRFELNRGNMAIIWAFILNLDFSCLLPRQSYKSYTIDGCYNWLMYWGAKNTKAIFLAHQKVIANQNLVRVKEISDTLPSYLDLRRKWKDKDNVNTLTFEPGSYVNEIRVNASAISKDHADKIGRGLSTREQFYDEAAFIAYIDTIYSSAIYAYSTVARIAERQNESHHIIMTTTAGSKLTPHGRWAYNVLYSSAQFNDCLYDMTTTDQYGNIEFDRNQVKEYIRHSTSKFEMIHIEYMYYDLSKGDEYLEDMRKKSDTEQAFNREVLNQWDDDVEGHPLGNKVLQKVRDSLQSPLRVVVVDKVYFLNIYKDLNWIKRNSDRIVFGMDCSTNTGGDFSTLVAIDIGTRETVLTMRANNYNIYRYTYAILTIMTTILTKSVAVIERNNVGSAIIDILASRLPNPKSRIYMSEDGKYGVVMNKRFRDEIMYGLVFRTSAQDYGDLVRDKYIIDEITDLIVTPKGRVDHKPGYHDDMVIGWLYPQWFCSVCKYRNKYYNALLFNSSYNDGQLVLDNNGGVYMERKSIMQNIIDNENAIKHDDLYDDTGISGNYFSGIDRMVSKMREANANIGKNTSVMEFDSGDDIPELTGNPDKDIVGDIESKVTEAYETKQDSLVKNPFKNKAVKKYLDIMSK